MDRTQIFERVRTVVAEIAEAYDHEVDKAHELQRDLGMDSFDRVELLNQIEDEFSITFRNPDDRALTAPTVTVAQLAGAVALQLGAL